MRISIITPTHKPTYILELWESIKSQTFQDFEWVIVLNNGAEVSIDDSRVKIIRFPVKTNSIGALKNFGFSQASGEILVEVDHDDLLTPDCLEELDKAFTDDIGFVYSNNAKLSKDFIPYQKNRGWEYRMFDGKYEMISFEPSSQSMSFIWYMPDHVRAWKSEVYLSLGGHKDLEVLDDQELLIRTYLTTKMKHIDKCLYLYRITGDNTWLEKNKKIQTETVNIFCNNAYALAERDAELKGLKKIDLGGGFDKPDGYISLDAKNGDVICDLNERLPLEDNSVGVIRAHDILEHLKDKQHIMSECHRVLCDGGWLMVAVPSTDGRGAFQDPTHISYWNQNSFWYWTRKQQAKYIYNDTIKFQEFHLQTFFPSDWHKENNIPYTVAYLSAIKSDKKRPHINGFD